MNRMDELREMQMLCAETPQELEFVMQRAVDRAAAKERRTKRVRRALAPLASLAAAAAVFVIMVNASVPFAMACNQVPGLSELTQMVAHDPSLRMALEHDYIQLVKQTASDGGLTVSIEYLIADRSNLILFYRAADENGEPLTGSPELLDENGVCIEGYSASWGYPGEDELQHAEFIFPEGDVPERFGVLFTARGEERADLDYEIRFDRIDIKTEYQTEVRVVTADQEVEILGQKLLIEQVELYPLQTRIIYRFHENNTAKFTGLTFYLTDSAGNVIGNAAGGITGFGAPEEENRRTAILDTVWWEENETYTLCIDEAAIVYYDAQNVYYDPASGSFEGLPEYITVMEQHSMMDTDYDTYFQISCSGDPVLSDIFEWQVYDAETGEAIEKPAGTGSGVMSWRPYDENISEEDIDENTPGYFVNTYTLGIYEHPVIFRLDWAPAQKLEPPIRILLV